MSDRQLTGLVGGRYEIEGLIASGGMGSVYRAFDTVLERVVALKVLRETGDDPAFTARFRTEATNAARLSHPGIVQVYDFGYSEEIAYMAMEYVEGRTLREIMHAEGVLRPEQAARIAADVATALEHARRAGIVHRDVKPENILVTPDGQVKVADFGLSRAFAAAQATLGKLYGTAHYLAPEQVQGSSVDHRTDVYALGIVLYEMITGRPPFDGDSPASIAFRRVNEDVPSAMARNPSVPRDLDAVVLRATARDPQDRFTSAGEMATALRATSTGATDIGLLVHQTAAVPVDVEPTIAISRTKKRTTKKRRKRWLALALVLTVAAVGGIYSATRLTTIAVPSVVGATQKDAKTSLEAQDLRVDIVLENDPQVAEGRVISQDPLGSTQVRAGSVVTLIVSLGPERVSAPSVVGKLFEKAEATLRARGFMVKRVDEFDESVPRLRVIRQSIEAGILVEKGSTVTLTVSKGPELVRVPDVKGDPVASARADLERLEFTVTVEEKQDSKVPAGSVISQSPAAGTSLRKGSVVKLVVSTGPPMVRVPNLECMTRRQAEDALANEGFKARFEGSGQRVVDQQPSPKERAPKGSTVTAQLGSGSFC